MQTTCLTFQRENPPKHSFNDPKTCHDSGRTTRIPCSAAASHICHFPIQPQCLTPWKPSSQPDSSHFATRTHGRLQPPFPILLLSAATHAKPGARWHEKGGLCCALGKITRLTIDGIFGARGAFGGKHKTTDDEYATRANLFVLCMRISIPTLSPPHSVTLPGVAFGR